MKFQSAVLEALLLVSLLGCAGPSERPEVAARPTAASKLLNQAIAYHDPNGVWAERPLRFELEWSDTEGEKEEVKLFLDQRGGRFACEMKSEDKIIEVQTHGDSWSAKLNGTEEIPEAEAEKYSLTPQKLPSWRNYFEYLYGLPMKLKDPGTLLDPEPLAATFQDREVLALRVTYEPGVGKDTWYFYFDPQTTALLGYRYFHDESKRDGEYIVLSGWAEANGLRLPKVRRWYTNKEDKYVATATIHSFEIVESE